MIRRSLPICAALFAVALTISAQDKPAPARAETGPSAEQVLQKFVEATGGVELYNSVKTSVASGSFSISAAGIKGTITIYSQAPDKAYAVVAIPSVGKMEEGSDGAIAWENSAMTGARIKSGDEAAAALREAAMDSHTNWKKYYKSAVVDGSDTVDGKDCYKLVMTPNHGAPETVYFDKSSGYLVRQTSTYDTQMGPIPVDILVSDYRKQDGLMQPYHLVQRLAGQEIDIMLDKVVYNSDVPASRFELPAEIKALQDKALQNKETK